MSLSVRKLKRRIQRLKQRADTLSKTSMEKYRGNPCLYVRERLGMTPTAVQDKILMSAVTPPYRTLVRTGHDVGKSTTAAWLASFFYDTEDPSITVTTAPKEKQLRDILWRELRKVRRKARPRLFGFKGPASLTMESSDEHMVIGQTATTTHGFQGKHEINTYVIMDEAGGIKPEFFEASETMAGGEKHCLIMFLNPLSTACQAFLEEKSGTYTVITMSCLDHPNIDLELEGLPPIIPAAIRLDMLVGMIRKWCDAVDSEDAKDNDFEFPREGGKIHPQILKTLTGEFRWKIEAKDGVVTKGQWWRPGPEAQGRVLGVWPSAGANTIWSELLFQRCRKNHLAIKPTWRTAIGCDIARYGDDMTEIAVRRGCCLVHLESHSGWDVARTTGRLKQLCHEFNGPEDPKRVRVFVDETGGLGSGPVDFAGEYNIIGVNSSEASLQPDDYKNIRTQLWFDTRNQAREGLVDFSRLFKDQANELEKQFLAQTYKVLPTTGQSMATDKDVIKKILKRSPDGADAVNLCYAQLEE